MGSSSTLNCEESRHCPSSRKETDNHYLMMTVSKWMKYITQTQHIKYPFQKKPCIYYKLGCQKININAFNGLYLKRTAKESRLISALKSMANWEQYYKNQYKDNSNNDQLNFHYLIPHFSTKLCSLLLEVLSLCKKIAKNSFSLTNQRIFLNTTPHKTY